jgi:predicted phosphodiesterase
MASGRLAKAVRELQGSRVERELERLRAENERLKHAKAHLQRVVEMQQERIARRAKVFKSRRAKSSGSFYRVVVPDSHGAHIDAAASAAFLGDLELLRPREVVWIGDHLDCGGFLAQHHTLGYVPDTAYSFADDVEMANQFIDSVQARAPDAAHHYVEGNHENRVERWCIQQTLGKGIDAEFLLKHFGPESVLNLGKRGIPYYRRSRFYHGVNTPGTIKLGACHFTHGFSAAKHAASAVAAKFASNVVFGHTHRIDVVITRLVTGDLISASVGCLTKLQPLWRHTDPTGWAHGYGLQIVAGSGDFLHITVPIVEGVSLLGPLLGKVG